MENQWNLNNSRRKAINQTTPATIRNNPSTACQLRLCLKNKYPNIAIVNIPNPLQVAYTIAMGILCNTWVRQYKAVK